MAFGIIGTIIMQLLMHSWGASVSWGAMFMGSFWALKYNKEVMNALLDDSDDISFIEALKDTINHQMQVQAEAKTWKQASRALRKASKQRIMLDFDLPAQPERSARKEA